MTGKAWYGISYTKKVQKSCVQPTEQPSITIYQFLISLKTKLPYWIIMTRKHIGIASLN